MDSTQYSLYVDDIISLSTYMVLKSSGTADAINAALNTNYTVTQDSIYLVNDGLPETWKYYMNLAGEYHPSDTMMTVISQDTLETINFTTANLAIHTATAAAYAPGSRYYLDLVNRYPLQSQLIRGIVNPVDIDTAIAADDGTILWYDTTLVESNEMNLISDLQNLIYQYYRRWYVAGYAVMEDLYVTGFLASLYAKLPGWIITVRKNYCKTYQAHSYHVKAYLTSKAPLDDYVDSMTLYQRLFFYRNLDYILRNAGKQSTFDLLVQNVMTIRGLPLAAWDLSHDETNLVDTYLPSPIFVKRDLNILTSDSGVTTRTVEETLNAESQLTVGNANFASDGRLEETTAAVTYTKGNEYLTKILESTVLDTTDASSFTLTDALFNHWLYWSSTGRYTAAVEVTNPNTGDTYNLTSSEAVLVYAYTYALATGITPDVIPKIRAMRVIRDTALTQAQVQGYMQMQYLGPKDLPAMLGALPKLEKQYISITSFNSIVRSIHDCQLFQHDLYSAQGNLYTRLYLSIASKLCYEDIYCDFGAGQSFSDWMTSQSIDLSGLTQDQYLAIASGIIESVTGANLVSTESVGDIQKAMLGIMKTLSSYSIQYIANVNSSPVIAIDRAAIRMDTPSMQAAGEVNFYDILAVLMEVDGFGKAEIGNLIVPDVSGNDWEVSGENVWEYDATVDMMSGSEADFVQNAPIPRITAGLQWSADQTTTGLPIVAAAGVVDAEYQPAGIKALPEAFSAIEANDLYVLTDADQVTLAERYNAYQSVNGRAVYRADEIILIKSLNGLTPPSP